MADRSRMPGLRQAEPREPLSDDEPVPFAGLFTLTPRGEVRLAHLEPLRRCLTALGLALDGFRFAAEDAVSDDPLMATEALRIDIARYGADLREQLDAALVELDILGGAIRAGGRHVA